MHRSCANLLDTVIDWYFCETQDLQQDRDLFLFLHVVHAIKCAELTIVSLLLQYSCPRRGTVMLLPAISLAFFTKLSYCGELLCVL